MLKYFRNKKVAYRYEYNNSLGGHQVREGVIEYDRFEIRGSGCYLHTILKKHDTTVLEQEFDGGWYFTGLGKLEVINSGPRCHFHITISN